MNIPPIFKAIDAGDLKWVQDLIQSGVDPNQLNQDGLSTPVHAAIHGLELDILRFLLTHGGDPNRGYPYTPLETAINKGNAELMKVLLECGAEVNHPTFGKETPLQLATRSGKRELVEMLLEHGADPDRVAHKEKYEIISNFSPIEYASMTGNKAMLQLLMSRSKRSTAEREQSMFIASIIANDLAAVKAFVKAHPGRIDDIDETSGRTPLVTAAISGRISIVKCLLTRGADINKVANKTGLYQSPLIAAVCHGTLPLVQLLVKSGADLEYSHKNDPKATALAYAKDSKMLAIAAYLQRELKSQGKVVQREPVIGVLTFDTNDSVILVDAPVEEVSSAWAARMGKCKVTRDCYGKQVTLTSRCYGVFRIKDQDWTSVIRLCCDNYRHWPSARDAQEISKSLGCRAYFFANSDTAGASQFACFDKGRATEYFEHGDLPKKTSTADHVRRVKDTYSIDISPINQFQIKGDSIHGSTTGPTRPRKSQNDLKFIEELVRANRLFVPFFPEALGVAGERVEVVFEDFGPDDLERMDVISCKESAHAARTC
jgi:ankyrin repeat protein